MVKSAEQHQWQKAEVTPQRRGPGKATWSTGLALAVKRRHIVQTRQHCLMSMLNAAGGTACTDSKPNSLHLIGPLARWPRLNTS